MQHLSQRRAKPIERAQPAARANNNNPWAAEQIPCACLKGRANVLKSIATLPGAITLRESHRDTRARPTDHHTTHSMIGYYQNNPIIIDSWTPYLAYLGTTREVQVGVKTRTYGGHRWAQPARLHPAPGHIRFSTSVNLPVNAVVTVDQQQCRVVAALGHYYDAIPI
jgi:hypothetical protein